MKKQATNVNGDVSGCHNHIGNHLETTNNYTGLSREDLVSMLEERFHHMLAKEVQVDAMFAQIVKFGDEIIRQNADFRMYNDAYRRQAERIVELTDKLLKTLDP